MYRLGIFAVATWLVSHGVAITAFDDTSDLVRASFEGDTARVEALIRDDVDVNALTSRDLTALIVAAHEGHAPIVQMLVDAGADVNAQSRDGSFPLGLAAAHGHVEAVKVLLSAKARTFLTDYGGKPPLVRAADAGHTEIVALLEKAGAARLPSTRVMLEAEPAKVPKNRGELTPPKKTRDVPPVYPDVASWAGLEGVVMLETQVRTDGTVGEVRVVQSIPGLDHAASDAVRQWRYEPGQLDGEPIPLQMTVTVKFDAN